MKRLAQWTGGLAVWWLLVAVLVLLGAGLAEAKEKKVFVDTSFGKKADVIVMTETGLTVREMSYVGRTGGKIKKSLPSVKGFAAELPGEAVDRLAADPNVKAIVPDLTVRATGTLKLARSVTNSGAGSWETSGPTIAVLDSGLQKNESLSYEDLYFKDFVGGKTRPYDDNGHGTAVAGVITMEGGGDNNGFLSETRILAVKVLAADGSGKASTVINAINWVVANKALYKVRVINLSLGAPATLPYDQDPLAQTVEWAWNNGIVVVTAAGNAGPEAGTVATPGIDPLVITVGATNDVGTVETADDSIAPFSSRGSATAAFHKPDLVAPGTRIITLRAQGSYIEQNYPSLLYGSNYVQISGTSFAAPMVSAQVAWLLERFPKLTPNQVKNVVLHTAADVGKGVYAQGYGYENVRAAIDYVKALGDQPETKISIYNPGLTGTPMAEGDGLTGQHSYDWLMQDGLLVDDQLIRWLRDNRGLDEYLIRWFIDRNLIDQQLILYVGDNVNLTPETIEPQLIRWFFDAGYLTTLNVDAALIRWMTENPAVQYVLADWLAAQDPIINDQLIRWFEARGLDAALVRWLVDYQHVDAVLVRWLADHHDLSASDVDGNLVRWLTQVQGSMNDATVDQELVRWLGTEPSYTSSIQAEYNVWSAMFP